MPDGDWKEVHGDALINKADARSIATMLSNEEQMKALAVIVSTKAQWWAMNHHTDQSYVDTTGFVKKISKPKYEADSDQSLVRMAHTLGHWCSTRYILTKAGVKGILPTQPIADWNFRAWKISKDAENRFKTFPAGTHRLQLVKAGLLRMLISPLARLCPNLHDFKAVGTFTAPVELNPADYHMGAYYLTRKERAKYEDSICDGWLGRVGTYLRSQAPKSSLTASPHFEVMRIQSYDDYSKEFEDLLSAYKSTQIEHQREAVRNLGAAVHFSEAAVKDIYNHLFRRKLPLRMVAEALAMRRRSMEMEAMEEEEVEAAVVVVALAAVGVLEGETPTKTPTIRVAVVVEAAVAVAGTGKKTWTQLPLCSALTQLLAVQQLRAKPGAAMTKRPALLLMSLGLQQKRLTASLSSPALLQPPWRRPFTPRRSFLPDRSPSTPSQVPPRRLLVRTRLN